MTTRMRQAGRNLGRELVGAPDDSDTFAERLRTIRERAGLSQSRLAAAAGYDHSYVSRLEMAPDNPSSRHPTRDAVVNLAAAMGCDGAEADDLLMAAGFLPEGRVAVIRDEPVLCEAYGLLTDPLLPSDVREDLRSAVWMALRQAQRAVAS